MFPFFQDDAFGPDALRAMSIALEEVCGCSTSTATRARAK
jgi:hypothetical protein